MKMNEMLKVEDKTKSKKTYSDHLRAADALFNPQSSKK
jgi:hypothetical protein